MSPVVVALLVGAIALVLGSMLDIGVGGLGILIVTVIFAWWRASDIRDVVGDESTSAPTFDATESAIDPGEEMLDLLTSARQRSARMLEDHGRLDPFVMYEDREGSVRIRPVEVSDPAQGLGRAREAARSVDPSAPRLVIAVADRAMFRGKDQKVVRYEAAERRFRDRTLVFVQPIRDRRLIGRSRPSSSSTCATCGRRISRRWSACRISRPSHQVSGAAGGTKPRRRCLASLSCASPTTGGRRDG